MIGLKMKNLELDSGLKICTDFQKQAAEALTRLESETMSYEKRQKEAALVKGTLAAVGGAGGKQIVVIELTWRVLLKISNITGA